MKKIALIVVSVLAVALVAVLAMASMQPSHIHMDRSIVVDAQPVDMVAFSEDLRGVNAWSPWEGKDPNQERTYSKETSGVGAWYHWKGNDEVGEGKMTIKSIEPGKVVIDLAFLAPFESNSDATITYAAEGEGTKVTWAYDHDANFMMKMMTLTMDMEEMLGPDYEAGLAMLKPRVEKAAQERMAAEAGAAAEAAAAAAEGAEDAEDAD